MPASYETWTCDIETFVFKAQQNLIFAEEARKKSRFDIEVNRVYYALHQLACELVRLGKMTIRDPSGRATSVEPWRIPHGSYGYELRTVLGKSCGDADAVIATWQSLRIRADYYPEPVSASAQWRSGIDKRRRDALRVAEAIYEKTKG
jgi:hypothetical protein